MFKIFSISIINHGMLIIWYQFNHTLKQ